MGLIFNYGLAGSAETFPFLGELELLCFRYGKAVVANARIWKSVWHVGIRENDLHGREILITNAIKTSQMMLIEKYSS